MTESFFDIFEKTQHKPICLEWTICPDSLSVCFEEYLFSGDLITVKQNIGVQKNAFYILTTNSIIESSDSVFKNPVNAIVMARLRYPRLKKVDIPSQELY